MPYNVTQTYTYTGDSVFDSAGTFKAWYHAVDSDFKVAVETATGTPFNQALFDVKQAQPVTETWDVDDQKLIKTIAWAVRHLMPLMKQSKLPCLSRMQQKR